MHFVFRLLAKYSMRNVIPCNSQQQSGEAGRRKPNIATELRVENRPTVVSRIYAPPFATLALVENVGGAYMRDLTFYLANTLPLPVPRLDVDITLYYSRGGSRN